MPEFAGLGICLKSSEETALTEVSLNLKLKWGNIQRTSEPRNKKRIGNKIRIKKEKKVEPEISYFSLKEETENEIARMSERRREGERGRDRERERESETYTERERFK